MPLTSPGHHPLSTEPVSGVTAPPRLPPVPSLQIITAVPGRGNLAGWQRVETNLAAFMIPSRYELVDLGSGFGELFTAFTGEWVGSMGELAQEFKSRTARTPTSIDSSGMEPALPFDFMMTVDTDLRSSLLLFGHPLEGRPNLAKLMEEMLVGFGGSLEIQAMQILEGSTIPTGRIVLLIEDPQ
jgi:hypothetical protein